MGGEGIPIAVRDDIKAVRQRLDGKVDVTERAAATIATNQVSVGASATLIVTANASRKRVTIVQHGTTDVYLGGSGVTTSTGALLAGTKGNQLIFRGDDAIYGIVASGTQTVSYTEETV